MIKFALKTKIPLFHVYLLSFVNFFAVSRSGFSTKLSMSEPFNNELSKGAFDFI